MTKNIQSIDILKALLPTLKLAGEYACNIQQNIQTQPAKEQYGDNFYATALTDADLTVQTAVELALLAQFPEIHFFGEEHEKSYNTKYFKSITFGSDEDLLVTLDPIDGTKYYLDGLPYFSIIVTIIKGKSYEAVLVLQPKRKQYLYALRDKGAFIASINEEFDAAKPLLLAPLKSNKIYLSFALDYLRDRLANDWEVWCSGTDYSPDQNPPEYLDLIQGKLAGVILGHGNLIDSAALAFIAKEMGAIATTWTGEDFEPFTEVKDMKINGLIVARNQEIHQKLKALLEQL